ncbi:MAG: hypothetical protein A2958_02365 [Candidatus Levybacteria bacterium RIFCSPLOWO2_01_FULL_38_13]|nr:MAG: hypothetical protein A2629_03995 [Candidatus Levybacteria bacterium RIFCSPHIGHO2_01_FULL_41_15]OGH35093.1 MAG: hypothetical protein A2958_02365 [Candidatus Levybacteria bacterium RIFCSPLOWO2_01_FULL_38_13]
MIYNFNENGKSDPLRKILPSLPKKKALGSNRSTNMHGCAKMTRVIVFVKSFDRSGSLIGFSILDKLPYIKDLTTIHCSVVVVSLMFPSHKKEGQFSNNLII